MLTVGKRAPIIQETGALCLPVSAKWGLEFLLVQSLVILLIILVVSSAASIAPLHVVAVVVLRIEALGVVHGWPLVHIEHWLALWVVTTLVVRRVVKAHHVHLWLHIVLRWVNVCARRLRLLHLLLTVILHSLWLLRVWLLFLDLAFALLKNELEDRKRQNYLTSIWKI